MCVTFSLRYVTCSTQARSGVEPQSGANERLTGGFLGCFCCSWSCCLGPAVHEAAQLHVQVPLGTPVRVLAVGLVAGLCCSMLACVAAWALLHAPHQCMLCWRHGTLSVSNKCQRALGYCATLRGGAVPACAAICPLQYSGSAK